MDKFVLRRVSAGIALVSFLLPWFDFFFLQYSGFQLIIEGFSEGFEESIVLATIVLTLGILALLVIIIPKLVPAILFTISGSLWMIIIFLNEDLREQMAYGLFIFLLGVIGVFIAFFLKRKQSNVTNQTMITHQQIASTYDQPNLNITPNMNPNATVKYCIHCGKQNVITNKFCPNCGGAI